MNEAQAPAAAYRLVADFLGPQWFLAPEPKTGYLVELVGLDHVPSSWLLDPIWARSLIAFARSHVQLAVRNVKGFVREGDPSITTWHAGG